jgi:hypothetical protein
MRWAQLYSPHDEARLGDQRLADQDRFVANGTFATSERDWEDSPRPNSWRAGTYWAVLLLFLLPAGVVWTGWSFSGQNISDWKPVLALADAALQRGDLHYAKSLYLQAGRLSAGNDDWAGLLTAACGMRKMERQRGRHSETTGLLLNGMVAAKAKQSRSGLVEVANAFTALGLDKVASMVLSHAEQDWVEETGNSAEVVPLDCWNRQG